MKKQDWLFSEEKRMLEKSRERDRKRYPQRKKQLIAYTKQWRKDNPEKLKEQKKRYYERKKLENKPKQKPIFESIIAVRSDEVARLATIKQSLGVDKRKKHTNVWYATDDHDKVIIEFSIRRKNSVVRVY